MTDAILKIEDTKLQHVVTSADVRKLLEAQVEELFPTVPVARVLGEKTVRTGIQLVFEGKPYRVQESGEEIQLFLQFETNEHYNQALTEVTSQSTEKTSANSFFAIGILDESWQADVEEAVRCEAIYARRNSYEGKEIADYMEGQKQDAERLKHRIRTGWPAPSKTASLFFGERPKPPKPTTLNRIKMPWPPV